MNTTISQAELNVYRQTARQRWQQQQQAAEQLRTRAWQVAQRAALLLREEFGATQVIVFGSLARGDVMHAQSDVDLAVTDLDDRQYYRAVGRLQSLDPDLAIDVVRMEDAPTALRAVIAREGSLLT